MSNLPASTLTLTSTSPALPSPRGEIRVRAGTKADIDFIDALQKKHGKQLGFMNRATLEGKVAAGHVLIAEVDCGKCIVDGGKLLVNSGAPFVDINAASARSMNDQSYTFAGYLIGNDRYRHRDELGVIFQMCVAPAYRRSLVAAHLLKAQFERSAYGCKLYCCWCAQDIEANRFWESMGFVPIAFRAGSEKRDRLHIFWQRRIRAGDNETPWWFPSETTGGMMDASRIALPIPPGMHWTDALPRLIPTAVPEESPNDGANQGADGGRLLEPAPAKRATSAKRSKLDASPSAQASPPPVITGMRGGGLRLTPDVFEPPTDPAPTEALAAAKPAKPSKPKRVKKASPELAAKARELRDRWMEAAARGEGIALPAAKYEIGRLPGDAAGVVGQSMGIENATLTPRIENAALPARTPLPQLSHEEENRPARRPAA